MRCFRNAGLHGVFATLGYNAPVSALSAVDGKTLATYEGTEYADEIIHQVTNTDIKEYLESILVSHLSERYK